MRPAALALSILASLLLGALGGCGDDDEVGAALKGPVMLEVSGGFAGLRKSIVVDPDGTVTVVLGRRSETATFSADDLQTLAGELEASGLFTEDRQFRGRGADLRTYTVTYDGATVAADDGVVPPELGPVIERLEGFRP